MGQRIRKRTQIKKVVITKGFIEVFDTNDETIKLTRQQRNLLGHYKNPNFVENLQKEFGNNHILSDDFSIEHDGKVIR